MRKTDRHGSTTIGRPLRSFHLLASIFILAFCTLTASAQTEYRTLQTITGHSDDITSVIFSPEVDNPWFIAASTDGTASTWLPASGGAGLDFTDHNAGINAVAFSPTEDLVATGSSDNTVRLWIPNFIGTVNILEGHTGPVNAVAFSPDGTQIATGSSDNTAKLWRTEDGHLLQTFTGHTGSVTSIIFAPDHSGLVTGSADTTAKFWTLDSSEALMTFSAHSDTVNSVDIFVESLDKTAVSKGIFAASGTLMTTSNDGRLILWDLVLGLSVWTAPQTSIPRTAVFSPDGAAVLVGYNDGTAKAWSTAFGSLIGTATGHTEPVTSVAYAADGQFAGTGSEDNTARVWLIADTEEPIITLQGIPDMALECGETFVDPGATATDEIDGDLTASIVVGGSTVNNTRIGTYTLRYNVQDNAGNSATQMTRTVTVQDTTAPTITLLGGDITVECGQSYTDPGFVAIDACAGNLSQSVAIANQLYAPAYSSHVLTYTLSDPSGNSAISRDRMVTVVDTTPPTLTLNGPEIAIHPQGCTYTDQGVSVFDNCDFEVGSNVIANIPVDESTSVGTYQVTYNVTDNAGNSATQLTRTVIVVDELWVDVSHAGTSDGSLQNPFTTIRDALQFAGERSQSCPVTIRVQPGTYTQTWPLEFPENISLIGNTENPEDVIIQYFNIGDTIIYLAENNVLENLTITTPEAEQGTITMVEARAATFRCENVIFDGKDNGQSTGLFVVNNGLSSSFVRNCIFRELSQGLIAKDASPKFSRSTFENIRDRAVLVDEGEKGVGEGLTPVIGDQTDPESGFNTFIGDEARFITNRNASITKAELNLFLTSSGSVIVDEIAIEENTSGADTVDLRPILKAATIPGSVTGTVTAQSTGQPIPGAIVFAGPVPPADRRLLTETDLLGNYNFLNVLPGSMIPVLAQADNFLTGTQEIDVAGGTLSPNINFSLQSGLDTTKPVIVLLGDASINLTCDDAFDDPGATATDDTDGDISIVINVGGDSVDTTTPGTYQITYDVTDTAGNTASTLTRTVNVTCLPGEGEGEGEGEGNVVLPNVVGLDQSAAINVITSIGLILGTITEEPSDAPEGEVLEQDPPASATVAIGTPINFTISSGAEFTNAERRVAAQTLIDNLANENDTLNLAQAQAILNILTPGLFDALDLNEDNVITQAELIVSGATPPKRGGCNGKATNALGNVKNFVGDLFLLGLLALILGAWRTRDGHP